MNRFMIFDLHCDLECYLTEHKILKQRFYCIRKRDLSRHADIPQFRNSGYKIIVANVFPFKRVGKKKYEYSPLDFESLINKIKRFRSWLNRYEELQLIFSRKDLDSVVKDDDRIGIVLGIEGLDFLSKVEEIDSLYKLGIRCFGLNWRDDSAISGSSTGKTREGLSELGRTVLKHLSSFPCVLDLAHASESSLQEIADLYPNSVIFSHTGVWEVIRTRRNVKFEIASKFVDRGSLMGICVVEDSISKRGHIDFNKWFRHIQYIEERKPISAIGTDFFGTWFNRSSIEFRNVENFGGMLRTNKVSSEILFNRAFNLFSKNLP